MRFKSLIVIISIFLSVLLISSGNTMVASASTVLDGARASTSDLSTAICDSVIDVPQTECLALIALYNSTNGDNWDYAANWGVGTTVDSWYGVYVNDGHVTGLYLGENWLSGSIPPAIGNLAHLSGLDLSGNQLSGNVPVEIGNLTALVEFRLSGNRLSGSIPSTVGDLTNLKYLDLASNRLTGSIPSQLGNMIDLQELLLGWNQLSGSIPTELGNLTNLYQLSLNNNQLTGNIPSTIGSLTKLDSLSLDNNQLSGSIPAEFGNLTNLTYLSLNNNQLSGGIPAEFGNLIWLEYLFMQVNQLSGSIPAELGNLTYLQYLNVASNQLSGSIPPELGNLIWLEQLNMQINQLTGSIPPDLGNLTNLQILYLGLNQFSGSIPPELGNLANLQTLFLSLNDLSGSIPPELGNLANLRFLSMYANELSGSIPPELGNLTNLQRLELPSNQLSGSIPPELGNLTNLWQLWLEQNQLSGSIPQELGSLTGLTYLNLLSNNLSGNIPVAIGSLTNLQHLNLGHNALSGEVPVTITNLTKLTYLNIHYNSLVATDPAVRAFLDAKAPGWETTQSTPPLFVDDPVFQHRRVTTYQWETVPSAGTYDGNEVRIVSTIRNNETSGKQVELRFYDIETAPSLPFGVTSLYVGAGEIQTKYYFWDTSGYAWNSDGSANSDRQIRADLVVDGTVQDSRTVSVKVKPKPVVLVHGFTSNAGAWSEYVGDGGFLQTAHPDWRGYAVGDGKYTGRMNTGEHLLSTQPTKSIEENATELATYIKELREDLNSWHIDLVGHSMGGLISRQYIHDKMPDAFDGRPVVGHLVMLGTPNAGSVCADVFNTVPIIDLQPARKQLTTSYVSSTFNSRITNNNGVPFYVIAGNPMDRTCSPLSSPGDSTVAVASATTPMVNLQGIDISSSFHTQLNVLYTDFLLVKARLAPGTGVGMAAMATTASASPLDVGAGSSLQTLFIGSVDVPPGGTANMLLVVPVVPSGSRLSVSLLGPSVGSTLLDPSSTVVDSIVADSDRAQAPFRTLFAESPLDGEWVVQFDNSSAETATVGVAAVVEGDPVALALDVGTPTTEDRVQLTLTVTNNSSSVTGAAVSVMTEALDGVTTTLTLVDDGAHDDGQAGDGVYGGQTDPLPPPLNLIYVAVETDDFTRHLMSSVEIDPRNQPPVANDDIVYVVQDTPTEIDALANDTDDQGADRLTINSLAQPANGLAANNRRNLTYIPDEGFLGSDSFTYTISDEYGSIATATVQVFVIMAVPPAAPSDLAVAQVSQKQIALTWTDNSTDEAAFHIERSVDGVTGWSEVGTVPADITAYTDTGLACSTYHYRVRAYRVIDGQFSGYSNIVGTSTTACFPTLVSPSNGSTTGDSVLTFEWDGVFGWTHYQIQVDDNRRFTNPEVDTTLDDTIYTVFQPMPDGRYYWRVRVINPDGDPGAWSAVWQVTIDTAPPDAPKLKVPRDRTNTPDDTPRFTWAAARGVDRYHLQVSDQPDFPDTDEHPLLVDDATLTRVIKRGRMCQG